MEWVLPAMIVLGLGAVLVGLATSRSRRSGDSDGGGIFPATHGYGDDVGGDGDGGGGGD